MLQFEKLVRSLSSSDYIVIILRAFETKLKRKKSIGRTKEEGELPDIFRK